MAVVSSIILAAGKSERMGRPKQLMPFGTSTIMEQTIDNLLHSNVNDIIVVLGYKAEEVREKIGDRPVKITVNRDYQRGLSTSIVAGLKLVDENAQAIMIALADQPVIDSKTINRLIKEFNSHDKGIAIPIYQGERGHPVIFSMRYEEELLGLKGDIGGRQIIEEHPDDVLEVAVASGGINIDIDTESDYVRARRDYGKTH